MKYLKAIYNSINDLIKEELSVSENLIKGVSACTERIMNQFERLYGNSGEIDGNVVTTFKDIISFGEYGEIECYVTVIDFPSKERMISSFKNYTFGGETDQLNYKINITVMAHEKEINKEFLHNVIYHESEHAYQFLRNRKELHGSMSVYHKAVNIISGNDGEHTSDEFLTVARLLYYFNKVEVEANVNGLYGELVNNGCKLFETNFKLNFDMHLELFNEFVKNYTKEKYSIVFSYFGITYKKFVTFVLRQEKYIIYRIRKVYQKALKDSNNQIVENKIIKPLGFYIK